MNNTNRALNRLGIIVFSLVLIVLGGGAVIAAAVPDWLAAWRTGAKGVADASSGVIKDTLRGATGQSWILLVIAAVAVVLIVLLLVFILRQGHGHTGTLMTRRRGDRSGVSGGSIVIATAVAEHALAAALKSYGGLASSSVSTYSVRGVATMKIAVSARRGVSPRDIRDYVDEIVRRWDDVLGEETPIFIKINGGFASRVAKSTRLPEQATV